MNLSSCFTRVAFPFAVAVSLAGCFAQAGDDAPVGVASQAAHGQDDCPDVVPTALTPAGDQTLEYSYLGVGVQIYTCTANATGAAWVFTAPQADLIDDQGHHKGTHFAGPTWESNDGSKVVAAKVAAVTVDATAIPWLLLTAISHDGSGHFADVTTVQRLDTVGGLAPATGCDATTVGSTAQVPYSAQYFLYKTKSHGHVHQCGDTSSDADGDD
jgi:hypothetical protein